MLLSYVSQHKCHRIKRKKEKRALKTYLEPSINGGCERLRLKANNGSIDVEFSTMAHDDEVGVFPRRAKAICLSDTILSGDMGRALRCRDKVW